MSNLPIMGKKLFISGGYQHEFSHIAWGDMKTQFYGYIEGYKGAADTVINEAVTRGFEKGDIQTLDTYIFPACFLYRQYIELTLKDIYLQYSGKSKDVKIETIKRCQHDLKEIWKEVKPLILYYFPSNDREPLEAAESYIYQFAAEDVNSFAFRYPITKELNLIKSDEQFINLLNLKERMDELGAFFSAINTAISVFCDYEFETSSYFPSGDG